MEQKERIYLILKNYIGNEYENKDIFMEKYNNIKDLSLDSLGIESIDFVNVILEIEKLTSKSINWNSFDINTFSTISKIEQYLNDNY